LKTVMLVRHGRAQWRDGQFADFDRPLDEQGRVETTAMAHRLAARGWLPEVILASAAERTRQTAQIFAAVLGLPEARVVSVPRLYLAAPTVLRDELSGLETDIGAAMLVGHNPGLSELAQAIVQGARLAELPTTAVCRIALDAPDWGSWHLARPLELELEAPPAAAAW
jgi:phosphohistidine phosphatase